MPVEQSQRRVIRQLRCEQVRERLIVDGLTAGGVDHVVGDLKLDIQHDPETGPGRPFSSRKLVECLTVGAERFGWARRNSKPGTSYIGVVTAFSFQIFPRLLPQHPLLTLGYWLIEVRGSRWWTRPSCSGKPAKSTSS